MGHLTGTMDKNCTCNPVFIILFFWSNSHLQSGQICIVWARAQDRSQGESLGKAEKLFWLYLGNVFSGMC